MALGLRRGARFRAPRGLCGTGGFVLHRSRQLSRAIRQTLDSPHRAQDVEPRERVDFEIERLIPLAELSTRARIAFSPI